YPINSELLAFIQVWRRPDGAVLVATKGAPEAVVGLCGLANEETAQITGRAQQLAERGLRILAVAEASWDERSIPDDPRRFAFSYLGLLAFEDPIRAAVPAATAEAKAAGIDVKMATGDFPRTARLIA